MAQNKPKEHTGGDRKQWAWGGQSETFPSSGSELLSQLSPLLRHIHIHHTGSLCSASIKTPEGLYWPKSFEFFSSRPVCNAKVVLTEKAEELHAYPTKWAKLASQRGGNMAESGKKNSRFLNLVSGLLHAHWWRSTLGKLWGESPYSYP